MTNYKKLYDSHRFFQIEKKYNIKFEDIKLLIQAFTHGSYNDENLGNYQRLEFLGDSILQVVVSDYMYRNYSYQTEGSMSKERGALVSETALAFIVRQEELDKYILFGNSLKKSEINNTNSYVSDVYEAFVAAIFLDQGYLKAEEFIKKTLINNKDKILTHDNLQDYKTLLQEELQVNGNIDIKYISEYKDYLFNAYVYLEDNLIGHGQGRTKKQAEQQAAKKALEKMV